MAITYFKRFRMEIDLLDTCPAVGELPTGYRWVSWDPALVNDHAETKFRSFQTEIDANVFPCFTSRDGCRRLMKEIAAREYFIPEATWLILHQPERSAGEFCGTVQGVRDDRCGSIQNVGITPAHRGRGLGTRLLEKTLHGFREAGLTRAYLEVTARNTGAIRLYERFGFRRVKTVYKSGDTVLA